MHGCVYGFGPVLLVVPVDVSRKSGLCNEIGKNRTEWAAGLSRKKCMQGFCGGVR